MGRRKALPESNPWAALDEQVKTLALAVLNDFIAKGDTAPGAMTVQQMQLHFTQMGWKVTRWVDEELKRRGV
jgi:hypothetical protein